MKIGASKVVFLIALFLFFLPACEQDDYEIVVKSNTTGAPKGWSLPGLGLDGSVRSFASDSKGNIYAGGNITRILLQDTLGPRANGIARWNGSSWSILGEGLGISVNAIVCDSKDNVYAAGSFYTSGDLIVRRIAMWNGNTWQPLGTGIEGTVHALAVDANDNIYAGGIFSKAGGQTTYAVAKWNGTSWSDLAGGLIYNTIANSSTVYALLYHQGVLYAGGFFNKSLSETPVDKIAQWNGSSWSPVGNTADTGTHIFALAGDSSGNIYVAGDYTKFAGSAATRIKKWNKTAWVDLGTGLNNGVETIACDSRGNLYAGGVFTDAGGVTVNKIAKWDGSLWSDLKNSQADMGGAYGVEALFVNSSDHLFVGGFFYPNGLGGIEVRYTGVLRYFE